MPAGEAPGWPTVAAAHPRSTCSAPAAAAPPGGGRRTTVAVVPDVADPVVTREERSPVRAALSRLPRKQAAALVLRHSGLSYAEVAAALELSPAGVGTTVRRAESALRKELNRHASSLR